MMWRELTNSHWTANYLFSVVLRVWLNEIWLEFSSLRITNSKRINILFSWAWSRTHTCTCCFFTVIFQWTDLALTATRKYLSYTENVIVHSTWPALTLKHRSTVSIALLSGRHYVVRGSWHNSSTDRSSPPVYRCPCLDRFQTVRSIPNHVWCQAEMHPRTYTVLCCCRLDPRAYVRSPMDQHR